MNKAGYVYLLKTSADVFKIGVSINVEKRIKQLQTGNTEEIVLVNKFYSNYPYKIEANLHRRYNTQSVKGEWFYLSDENVESFIKDCETCETAFKALDESDNVYFKKLMRDGY